MSKSAARWDMDTESIDGSSRPQVLEWTNNMSEDMINFDSFWDLPASTEVDRLIREPINGLDSLANAPTFFPRH